jgi:GNAT superfamily N-acetyltransferase
MSLRLTPVVPADLPAIVDLVNAGFRGTGEDSGWNSEAGFIDGDRMDLTALQEQLSAQPQGVLLVHRAIETHAVQACVWLRPQAATAWYLGLLTVDPRLQNAGLGRQLLAAAEQWAARERGAKVIRLKVVNVRETLIAWYQRRGYRLTGETDSFPYGDNRFGTPLRDDLSFVVLEKSLV